MYRNEIIKLNNEINVLKNEYTKELNTVNHYYWPIIAKIKKSKKNIIWYFTLALCFTAAVAICFLLFEVTNPDWIMIGGGICLSLDVLSFIFLRRILKKEETLKKQWKHSLKTSDEQKKQLDEQIENAKQLMIEYLGDSLEDKNASYEDILGYFNQEVDRD